ncbi:ClpA/ClpB-like protein [Leucobacter luti]|uniref:ClpA/ClpB-like protein n=1 Tax=Leucobacter luti TaxID=340320 RepID=A0A4R6RQQ1_9MICO|nr:SRPBCC family protein [Leucobacter luti]TDP89050.1 ClpA/ClpB-like protein [Leucobacter luti]
MSKFTGVASTSHMLSLAAMEEASRVGQRTADINHLLIALVLNEQIAGQVLRSFSITLDAAREAVAEQHADHLATLGIQTAAAESGRIVFHETNGYEWSERALGVIRRASEGGKHGDASAVLRGLVTEPSGMIEAILKRLDTTPEAITAKLDEAERYPTHRPQRAVRAGTLSGASEAFAPASPEQVWGLLTDPSRMPEWEPSIGHVEDAPAAIKVGETWAAFARTERPDGKPIPVKLGFITQHVEVVALEVPRLIEWRLTYPETPRANARCIKVEIEPAAGGTQLRLALAWERNPNRPRRSFLGFVMRPVFRLVLWIQLSQLGGGISRAFR